MRHVTSNVYANPSGVFLEKKECYTSSVQDGTLQPSPGCKCAAFSKRGYSYSEAEAVGTNTAGTRIVKIDSIRTQHKGINSQQLHTN